MGRFYTAKFEAVAISAAQDLFEVLAPADAAVKVHGWRLFQTTDVKDAEEEILRLETVRGVGSVTTGSGGTTVTPQAGEEGDPAFGGTVKANNTTRMLAGSGTLESLEVPGWNIRIPYDFFFPPLLLPYVSPNNRWTLALPVAPADALTCSGQLWLEEIGG